MTVLRHCEEPFDKLRVNLATPARLWREAIFLVFTFSSLRGRQRRPKQSPVFIQEKIALMLPPELANPFRRPPATPLNPDTAEMIGDMLGPEAKKAFEALDDEPKRPKEKPQELTEKEKAAIRQAQERLERIWEKKEFPTWKTIPLGEYKTVEKLIRALEIRRFEIRDRTRKILKKIHLSSSPTSVELVNVSVEDLGFEERATLQEIYDRAAELGLALCPAEVGPELRLQYSDQPIGERLLVAMESIAISYGDHRVFSVERDDDYRWLNVYSGNSWSVMDADKRWVFLHSKKK